MQPERHFANGPEGQDWALGVEVWHQGVPDWRMGSEYPHPYRWDTVVLQARIEQHLSLAEGHLSESDVIARWAYISGC